MARIDVSQLTMQAAGELVYRGNLMRQDPAWVKSAKIFGDDLARVSRSGSDFAYETRAAWQRTKPIRSDQV